MPWQRVPVLVQRVELRPDRVRIHCALPEEPSEPVVPVSLWSHPTEGAPLFDLHRVATRRNGTFVFETFLLESRAPPSEDSILYLQSHWLPVAISAALDTTAQWQHQFYPDDGTHAHCTFTWETISSYTKVRDGYWSEKYGWITCQAYDDFIVKDVYHLRERCDA